MRRKRTERGLTLEDVAVKIGTSVPHLSRIERDRENPPRDETLVQLAAILQVSLDSLFAEAQRLPPDLRPRAGEVFAAYRRLSGMGGK